MASVATLPLSEIVNVTVTVSPISPPTPQFNQGLIVGPSTVIPSTGVTNSRIRQYATLPQMLAEGFTPSSPEYIAAQIYFSQPGTTFLWVGRQDLTSMTAVNAHIGNVGSGYVVGDNVLVIHAGASGGYVTVTGIGVGGSVASIVVATINGVLADGTGYVISNGNTTTGGTGAGLEVDITAVGETPLIALQVCRQVNYQWYACMVTDAVTADHLAIAAWAQGIVPAVYYHYGTSDAAVLNNTAGNVFSAMFAQSYKHVLGTYSTVQGGAFPNNIYIGAATMGVMMGLNTGLANSYFTMAYKQLVGIAPEPLTQTQVNNIAGVPGQSTGNNGNVYVNFGNAYNVLIQGREPAGTFADETLNLDMLASDIQYSLMNLITENNSIPQTDPGQTLLLHQVNQAAQRAVVRGYIGPGTWEGEQLLNLATGDNLPAGFLTQSPAYATQAPADKAARKSMPIYLALNEAGAVQSIAVGIVVQR